MGILGNTLYYITMDLKCIMFTVLNSKYIRENCFGKNRINYIMRFYFIFMHILIAVGFRINLFFLLCRLKIGPNDFR